MTFPTRFARALAFFAAFLAIAAAAVQATAALNPAGPRRVHSNHLRQRAVDDGQFRPDRRARAEPRRGRCSSSGRAHAASNMAAATCCSSPTVTG